LPWQFPIGGTVGAIRGPTAHKSGRRAPVPRQPDCEGGCWPWRIIERSVSVVGLAKGRVERWSDVHGPATSLGSDSQRDRLDPTVSLYYYCNTKRAVMQLHQDTESPHPDPPATDGAARARHRGCGHPARSTPPASIPGSRPAFWASIPIPSVEARRGTGVPVAGELSARPAAR
jgi:hypothetical protein